MKILITYQINLLINKKKVENMFYLTVNEAIKQYDSELYVCYRSYGTLERERRDWSIFTPIEDNDVNGWDLDWTYQLINKRHFNISKLLSENNKLKILCKDTLSLSIYEEKDFWKNYDEANLYEIEI